MAHPINEIVAETITGLAHDMAGLVIGVHEGPVNFWAEKMPAIRVFDGNEVIDEKATTPPGQWRRFLMLHVDVAVTGHLPTGRRELNELCAPVESWFSNNHTLDKKVVNASFYSKRLETENKDARTLQWASYIFKITHITDYRPTETYPPMETCQVDEKLLAILEA